MHFVARILMSSTFLVAAVPAVAEPVDTASQSVAATNGDTEKSADRMICERVQEVGSLLRKKKVCMLKSQWDEQRRSDRANIERSQVQRGLQPAG